jgi:hypothetical protein
MCGLNLDGVQVRLNLTIVIDPSKKGLEKVLRDYQIEALQIMEQRQQGHDFMRQQLNRSWQ